MDGAETSSTSPGWYLSGMTVFKNEAPYLEEWLAFCMLEGIEHLLLYDNGSTDEPGRVLKPWMDAGFVELCDWPVHWKDGAQTKAFLHALERLRGKSRWTAFIDVDEFLFSPTGYKLPDVLRRYEDYAGVVVNWQCYGSSGHKLRPDGLTVESYTRRAETHWARNRRVKTIVNPDLAVRPRSAHLFDVQPNCTLVTEDFKPVSVERTANGRRLLRHLAARLPYVRFDPYAKTEPSIRQVSVSNLRINHYVTRSQEEMPLKYKDRASMAERDRRSHSCYHDRNEVEDTILVPKAAMVREIIRRVRAGVLNSSAVAVDPASQVRSL